MSFFFLTVVSRIPFRLTNSRVLMKDQSKDQKKKKTTTMIWGKANLIFESALLTMKFAFPVKAGNAWTSNGSLSTWLFQRDQLEEGKYKWFVTDRFLYSIERNRSCLASCKRVRSHKAANLCYAAVCCSSQSQYGGKTWTARKLPEGPAPSLIFFECSRRFFRGHVPSRVPSPRT